MNRTLAENLRQLREMRSWTQEELAEAAHITVRTVQRAEAAEGASDETMLAIAGALDVDVELLRFDAMAFMAEHLGVSKDALTPEVLAAKRKEIAATHVTLRLARVIASADLRPLSDADSMVFECLWNRDDVQDAAAEFQKELYELLDLTNEIDPVARRACEKAAFEHVRSLEKLGAAVTVGLHRIAHQTAIPRATLYVVVAKEFEAKEYVLIKRVRSDRFT